MGVCGNNPPLCTPRYYRSKLIPKHDGFPAHGGSLNAQSHENVLTEAGKIRNLVASSCLVAELFVVEDAVRVPKLNLRTPHLAD
jgi:hypothetical protein